MSHTLHIELDRCEGTLLRLLGLIERRGFHIDSLSMSDASQDRRALSVRVRPRDNTRNVDVLGRQIDRLYGLERRAPAATPVMAQHEPEIRVCTP
ncbi:MAG: ACT domain-containing protein [Asticcacaulis sp.]